MQSFPSFIRNDGRAAFNQHCNFSKKSKESNNIYAPKYAKTPSKSNNSDCYIEHKLTQKNINISNSENYGEHAHDLALKKDDSIIKLNKTPKEKLRRPNSAISYRNPNEIYNKQIDQESSPNSIINFDIESFLNTIQVESEQFEKNNSNLRKVKKKSSTRPSSPSDPNNLFAALPQSFVKPKKKKKENNKTTSSSKSIDYDHLNGKELFQRAPNLEKYATRLTKESKKDAVLQRLILAKYSENQIEYIGLNKEKKKSVSTKKWTKTSHSTNDSPQSNKSSSDNASLKGVNDDSLELKCNSATSTSSYSSGNQQKSNTNKQTFSKNDDKFSHLNCRMSSSINYNDLAKAQSKYTKKIKDTKRFNKDTIKKEDATNEPKNAAIPSRLFFSRTPLFDDPGNPKQRETQKILPSQPLQKSFSKERASTSRIYLNDSDTTKNSNHQNQSELNSQAISNDEQSLGPTPQSKGANKRILPMLSTPNQRASTNLSNLLSTPHSQSYHNSARKNSTNSLPEMNDNNNNDLISKKSNKPPIIPNSKSFSKKCFINNFYNNESNQNSNENSRVKKNLSISQLLSNTDSDSNLEAVPRNRTTRKRFGAHHSLVICNRQDNFFSALSKLHNLSDSPSPATPHSTNSINRRQNLQGIFKLNPILPNKKPKEEKIEEPEEPENPEKNKPVDSITFQMTALEKFKKDKKRKQLEEKGIYHYKKETNQTKNDKLNNEDDKSKENEHQQTKEEEEINSDQNSERSEEDENDAVDEEIKSENFNPDAISNIDQKLISSNAEYPIINSSSNCSNDED